LKMLYCDCIDLTVRLLFESAASDPSGPSLEMMGFVYNSNFSRSDR
jgi:hypothetical protein